MSFLINTRKLRKAVSEKQLKLYWLAEQARIPRRTLTRWLARNVVPITQAKARRLADLVEVPLAELQADSEACYLQQRQLESLELCRDAQYRANLLRRLKYDELEQACLLAYHPELPVKEKLPLVLDLFRASKCQLKRIQHAGQYLQIGKNLALSANAADAYLSFVVRDADLQFYLGKAQSAESLLKRHYHRTNPSTALHYQFMHQLAFIYSHTGRHFEAKRIYGKCIEGLRASDHQLLLALTLMGKGILESDLNHLDTAQECFEQAVEIGHQHDIDHFAHMANMHMSTAQMTFKNKLDDETQCLQSIAFLKRRLPQYAPREFCELEIAKAAWGEQEILAKYQTLLHSELFQKITFYRGRLQKDLRQFKKISR